MHGGGGSGGGGGGGGGGCGTGARMLMRMTTLTLLRMMIIAGENDEAKAPTANVDQVKIMTKLMVLRMLLKMVVV